MRFAIAVILLATSCSGKPAAPAVTGVGSRPPSITLTDGAGKRVALADVTTTHANNVIVFYRGYF